MISLRLVLAPILAAAPAMGQGREDVGFQLQHAPAPGAAVFLQGSLDELGGGDVLESQWMSSPDGVQWSITVSLPLGHTYSYRFIERQAYPTVIGDPQNFSRITDWTTTSTTPEPAPGRKSFQAYSPITAPRLRWRVGDGPFLLGKLIPFAPGRVGGELRYLIPSFASLGERICFYLESPDQTQRDPASGFYVTDVDHLLLQDGALYTYLPAAQVDSPRGDYDPAAPHPIFSNVLGVERHYRVRLPRGYDQHTERRYPVLYQYDGQWLWEGMGQFGFGVFDPDGARMTALVDAGLLAEVIQVGIDFPPTHIFSEMAARRWLDCGPPEDKVGGAQGMADKFLEFVTTELKPLIDSAYRSRSGVEHTFLQGYSFGGILATYAAWEFDDVFGGVAPQSATLEPTYVKNFLARLLNEQRRDARMFFDVGTLEPTLFAPVHTVVTNLLGKSPEYVAEKDLRFVVGYGHNHTYDRAAERLDKLGGLLFPMSDSEPEFFVGDRFCEGTINQTGERALVYSEGSLLAADNDLTLSAVRVPAGSFGFFLLGTTAEDLPGFAGGLGHQCVGGGVVRIGPLQASSEGVLRDTPDLSGVAAPGVTLHLQVLFRDGMTSNTSDALALTFE